jgi:hypothetical protein
VEGDERCCQKSHRTDKNVEKVLNLLRPDRCLSVRAMVVQLILDKEAVRQI